MAAKITARMQLEKGKDLAYRLAGKKAFPITSNGLVGVNVKGRAIADKELNPKRKTGAVELAWCMLYFQNVQDVRIKVGFEFFQKVPYFQIRENNWKVNAFMDGRWNVRFDL